MKHSAILLLAGSGLRFGSSIPKQFQNLLGKKVYRYSLDTLISTNFFHEILLVIQPEFTPYLDSHPECKIILGGSSRQKSVHLALKQCTNSTHVLIHDGVRPFLTKELLQLHLDKLLQGFKNVNTCIPSSDTINIVQHGNIISIPPRSHFLRGQTPQSFDYENLYQAHEQTNIEYTDDCSLMLDAGHEVSYVTGNECNIKITTSLDLKIAKTILLTFPSFSC
jgi:2-C-methyl-D-erythritol 4-phosphate cytidylyltransferase